MNRSEPTRSPAKPSGELDEQFPLSKGVVRGPLGSQPSHRPLNVAVVDEELPFPLNTGKRIRTFQLLSRLARSHQLTYFCHRNDDPEEARQSGAAFRDLGIEVHVVDRAVPSKQGPSFYARLAANLLSPLPYSVATHRSASLRRALQVHEATRPVDLWHIEWTPYADALRGVRRAPRLVMAHNVESQIWRRYYEAASGSLKGWYIGHQWRKFENFERWAFAEADRIVAVSPEDATLVRDHFGGRIVSVVDNGVDTSYFRPPIGNARVPKRILFLGSLDWRPNIDAVGLLLDRIFPAVQAEEPSSRLCLVGRRPPSWLVKRAAAIPGVELHADVDDVRPYMAASGMLAVPLRIGGGSRLKILEALAIGLPVVSTRIGAEGLALQPGQDLVVVEDVEEMAQALVENIRDPGPIRQMTEHGRLVVLANYDWDVLADRLDRVWLETASGGRSVPPTILDP